MIYRYFCELSVIIAKRNRDFKCLQCKTLLRLNKGAGEKEVHCPDAAMNSA